MTQKYIFLGVVHGLVVRVAASNSDDALKLGVEAVTLHPLYDLVPKDDPRLEVTEIRRGDFIYV